MCVCVCSLIGRKNQAKFENDCIWRNGHRIKITQANVMILVSFYSAEDDLSNDVKKNHNTFSSQGTENPLFHFWGTRYKCIHIGIYLYVYLYINKNMFYIYFIIY